MFNEADFDPFRPTFTLKQIFTPKQSSELKLTRDEFVECAMRSLQAIVTVASVPRDEAVRRAVDYAKAMKVEIESIKL